MNTSRMRCGEVAVFIYYFYSIIFLGFYDIRFVTSQSLKTIHLLTYLRISSFRCTQRSKHRQNVTQPEIVMHLLGKLLFAQLVKREKFARQHDVLYETASSQFDTHDDLTVGHHHGYRTKLNFQVLRKFLTTGVSRVL